MLVENHCVYDNLKRQSPTSPISFMYLQLIIKLTCPQLGNGVRYESLTSTKVVYLPKLTFEPSVVPNVKLGAEVTRTEN